MNNKTRTRAGAALAAVTLLVTGCGSGTQGTGTQASRLPSPVTPEESGGAYSTYPDSILVLGHSGPTGENSDPARPGQVVPENSWATGSNPGVTSVYQRILAEHAEIRGNNFNLAQGGATVDALKSQATTAGTLDPKPQLVLIQTMDADLECPATDEDVAGFLSRLVEALDVLERNLPNAKFFIVSQFGSPETYAKALSPAERRSIGDTGPCSFVDPKGRVVPKELARLEGTIQRYEAQLEAACGQFSQCRYDGGAFGRIVDKREYFSDDLNHFSIEGHAKAAAVAWAALKRVGLIP